MRQTDRNNLTIIYSFYAIYGTVHNFKHSDMLHCKKHEQADCEIPNTGMLEMNVVFSNRKSNLFL